MRADLKSIFRRCHLLEVAFVWELTKETIHFPLEIASRVDPEPHTPKQVRGRGCRFTFVVQSLWNTFFRRGA